jgi:hypothetical protein
VVIKSQLDPVDSGGALGLDALGITYDVATDQTAALRALLTNDSYRGKVLRAPKLWAATETNSNGIKISGTLNIRKQGPWLDLNGCRIIAPDLQAPAIVLRPSYNFRPLLRNARLYGKLPADITYPQVFPFGTGFKRSATAPHLYNQGTGTSGVYRTDSVGVQIGGPANRAIENVSVQNFERGFVLGGKQVGDSQDNCYLVYLRGLWANNCRVGFQVRKTEARLWDLTNQDGQGAYSTRDMTDSGEMLRVVESVFGNCDVGAEIGGDVYMQFDNVSLDYNNYRAAQIWAPSNLYAQLVLNGCHIEWQWTDGTTGDARGVRDDAAQTHGAAFDINELRPSTNQNGHAVIVLHNCVLADPGGTKVTDQALCLVRDGTGPYAGSTSNGSGRFVVAGNNRWFLSTTRELTNGGYAQKYGMNWPGYVSQPAGRRHYKANNWPNANLDWSGSNKAGYTDVVGTSTINAAPGFPAKIRNTKCLTLPAAATPVEVRTPSLPVPPGSSCAVLTCAFKNSSPPTTGGQGSVYPQISIDGGVTWVGGPGNYIAGGPWTLARNTTSWTELTYAQTSSIPAGVLLAFRITGVSDGDIQIGAFDVEWR